MKRVLCVVLGAVALVGTISRAQRGTAGTAAAYPISYRVSFPAPEHHWMQVEVTFTGLGTAPLDARMSRSSPGRYAVSEFAKNVFEVQAFNSAGAALKYTRPDADIWHVTGHDGTVKVVYKIFGDHANGTYLGVDTTHAHLNMPAAFMWATGHENQPMSMTFVAPTGSNWKVGTQLFTTSDPMTFTAPNLQYFMDSPTELSNFVVSAFTVPNTDGTPANFRLVAHSDGLQADVDELAKMVQRLVREQMAVYGEFPKYEPGNYTFLLDYVAWGAGDGMEHRNSTSISSGPPGLSLKTPNGRQQALDTISHEYFHNWNVERIRPAGLEPFDFTRENVTCCLWVAEGFTQYYGPLLLTRAGLTTGAPVTAASAVINTPGRAVRSPVQMSEYAPFADGAGTFVDATDGSRTFLSYYTYGAGIALALDLSIRELSAGKQSLDDFMRLMWTNFGKPGGPAPGLVGKPYTVKDLRDTLATLTGNRKFADDFFDKYVEGRDAPDYKRLLLLAGYSLPMAPAGRGWVGTVTMGEGNGGLTVGSGGGGGGRGGGRATPVPIGTPLYDAGLDAGDVITTVDGAPATMAAWTAALGKKPGEQIAVGVMRRDGATVNKTITLKQDPTAQRPVPIESDGGTLTDAQKAFRAAWLGTRVK